MASTECVFLIIVLYLILRYMGVMEVTPHHCFTFSGREKPFFSNTHEAPFEIEFSDFQHHSSGLREIKAG